MTRTLQDGTRPADGAAKTASLRTLSAHLGLSMASISRVLTGAPAAKSIPEATQQRILAAARELNYRPNQLARSLRSGLSTSVGVLIPEISEGYATPVLAGIEETLSAAGYILVMITHHHRQEVLARSQRIFSERAVDAIIAVDTRLPSEGAVPTVTISCPDPHASVTNIVLNHECAAELALTHLLSLGHRELAVIKGQPFSSDTEARWQAIQKAAERRSIVLHPQLVVQMEEDLPDTRPGFNAAQRLLSATSRFTAVLAFNDVCAIGATEALRHAGRHVPRDVSVLGFDDVPFAAMHRPPLTTIRQPLHYMGVLAATAVLETLASPKAGHVPSRSIVVEPELVVRDSTARCTSQVSAGA